MSQPAKQTKRIDELLTSSSVAFAREGVFEAERMANKALSMARQMHDFARMAESLSLLAETRCRRIEQAIAVNKITIISAQISDTMPIEPGCYLVEPPQVGADARRFRLAALQREVPVAVVCREPQTTTGLCPIVAIGAGGTVRTKIQPPRKPNAPTMQWFVDAMETLGDWAIETVDPEGTLLRRIDALFDRLDALPDHSRLHHVLEAACREAAAAELEGPSAHAKPTKKSGDSNAGRKSRINL